MKIAFISDIHGNAVALEAVLEDIERKNIEKVYVLGDICYRGPEPKRSLELVQSLDGEVIKGNADEWVVRGVNRGEVPDKVLQLMNKEREWIASKLDDSDIQYLKHLPEEKNFKLENVSFHLFHASPNSLFEIISPTEEDEVLKTKLLSSDHADIHIYGHIHKPYIRFINGKIVMNTGSVGLPFDGLPKASYGVVEIGKEGYSCSIERVNFNIEKVINQYKEMTYPNADMMINVLRTASI